jgi:ABC-type sugar transport system permease subunit
MTTTLSPPLLRKTRLSRRKLANWVAFLGFTAPNFILLGVFTFWPIAYNLYLSFFKWNMIAPVKTWVGLDNYVRMAKDPIFWQVLRNTGVLAAGTVFVKLAVALFLAVLLNQKVKGRDAYRAIIFSPTFTTSVAIAMVWSWIFDPYYGLLKLPLHWLGIPSPNWLLDPNWALPAVIIVVIWAGIGYDMVIFLAGLQAIPVDLYEAARVDGASRWSLFWRVTFPMLSPTTFFLLIISIIGAFKAFDIVAVMTGGGPLNSTNVYVYYLYQNAFRWFKAGYAAALAVALFLIILVITVIQTRLSRRWVHY